MTTSLKAPPYGRDTSATRQVHHGRVVKDGTLLAEAAWRRITTRRGDLHDDQNYGLLISDLLGADATPDEIAAIPGRIRQELSKDDRLDPANGAVLNVTMTQSVSASGGVALDIAIDGVGAFGGTFRLSIHADDLNVELLELGGT